jgi:hypothetical protein
MISSELDSALEGSIPSGPGKAELRSLLDRVVYNAIAASAVISNTIAETAFDKSYSIPANSLKAGESLHIRAWGACPSTNSTDTLNVKLRIGGTQIVATGAVDVANNDIFLIDVVVTFRAVGSSGTLVAAGSVALGASGTVTAKAAALSSTSLNTTQNQTIDVTATWSVANAGNQVRLDGLHIEKLPAA